MGAVIKLEMNQGERIKINMIESSGARKRITIRTFGNFDIYVDGEIIYFPHMKAKEMMAVLTDRYGSSINLAQMAYLLYEDNDEKTAKNTLRVVFYRLKNILRQYGIEDIVIKRRGMYALKTDDIECDYFEFIEGGKDGFLRFNGEYMNEYSWADETKSYVTAIYDEIKERERGCGK